MRRSQPSRPAAESPLCMTFDEQLSHTVDTLSGRLREEIARHLDSAAEDIAASAHAAREQATAEARSDAERVASDRLAAAVADAEARAYEYGKEEGDQLHTADVAARERLVASIRAIDAVHSLTDILDALAGAAAREAERVAVLLV